ncbi:MAG TPA: transglycosylase SLT domain-containing protein [Terriglobia bacterium]|nr:transglycosylase SLT domain-containing protein [Terriglobia bacterium]
MIPGLALAIPLCRGATAKAPRLLPLAALALAAQSGFSLPAGVHRPLRHAALAPKRGVDSKDTDIEIQRIKKDLERIERDPAARRAFYARIDRLIEAVRNHQPIPPSLMIQDELAAPVFSAPQSSTPAKPAAMPPAPHRFKPQLPSPLRVSASAAPFTSDGTRSFSLPQRQKIAPVFRTPALQIPDPTGNGVIDPRVVSRLLYWARRNNCPAGLALATAWQESRMFLHPPDGSSGEIGIMQILPGRAEAEGVSPRSLRDPDVDMWLGTKLLARYYREEGSVSRAAMKYVAGPGVFDHRYATDVRDYIAWYSESVDSYASYFGRYVGF